MEKNLARTNNYRDSKLPLKGDAGGTALIVLSLALICRRQSATSEHRYYIVPIQAKRSYRKALIGVHRGHVRTRLYYTRRCEENCTSWWYHVVLKLWYQKSLRQGIINLAQKNIRVWWNQHNDIARADVSNPAWCSWTSEVLCIADRQSVVVAE